MDEDITAPTPPLQPVFSWSLQVGDAEPATVFIGEDAVPWYVHACIRNDYDALRRSWGLPTRRDVYRRDQANAAATRRFLGREDRARLQVLKEHDMEWRRLEKAQRKEEGRLEAQRQRGLVRLAREEAKRQRALEREERRKEREKEKKRRQRQRQREAEKRRQRGDEAGEEEEEEEEPEEEEDEPEDEEEEAEEPEAAAEEDVEDEDEEEAEAEGPAEGEGEEDEEDEGEDAAGASGATPEGGEEAEEAEREAVDLDFHVALCPADPETSPHPPGSFTLSSMAEVLEERERLEAELAAQEAEDEEAEEAAPKTAPPPAEVEVDLLTLAVAAGAVDCAALLLAKGMGTALLEEFLEEVTTAQHLTAVHGFIRAAKQAHLVYNYPLTMNFSWLFRSVFPLLGLAEAEALLDAVLDAAVLPRSVPEPDAIHDSKEVLLFAKLLFKLPATIFTAAKPRAVGEEGEEEPPEEEAVEGEPGEQGKRGNIVAPPFMLALLQPPPPPLPRDLPADGPLATLEQRAHGRTLRLRVDWSDLATLAAALGGHAAHFSALLQRKAAAPHPYGHPPGTWEVLYKNAAHLTHEMFVELIRATPAVFKYGGGVAAPAFLRAQWAVLPEGHRQAVIHQFHADLLAEAEAIRSVPAGAGVLAEAERMAAVYGAVAGLLQAPEGQADCPAALHALVEEHRLDVFTPQFLFLAVEANNGPAVAFLLDHGCPAFVRPAGAQAPLDLFRYVVERRQLPLVLLLVGRGASLKDLWDGGRTTPLRYMKDRYDAAAYRQVLDRWKKVEGDRQADFTYQYGLLARRVTTGALPNAGQRT